jgi:hypothetical protein
MNLKTAPLLFGHPVFYDPIIQSPHRPRNNVNARPRSRYSFHLLCSRGGVNTHPHSSNSSLIGTFIGLPEFAWSWEFFRRKYVFPAKGKLNSTRNNSRVGEIMATKVDNWRHWNTHDLNYSRTHHLNTAQRTVTDSPQSMSCSWLKTSRKDFANSYLSVSIRREPNKAIHVETVQSCI